MANALLVYKQRHKPPNKANTAGKNTAHIIYIGTRPGVMKSSPEQQSGLFGNIGNGFSEHLDLNAVVSRADTISKAKKTMLRSVISFTSDQAKALKLKTLPDWQQYAKKQIPIIASHNNIKLENIEWAAAVHQKGDHPHVHIAFWDSSDRVQIQYIDPKVIGRLRCKLLDNTYPEMRERLIAAKNLSKEQLRQNYTENGIEAEIGGIIVTGSRSRGIENDSSDTVETAAKKRRWRDRHKSVIIYKFQITQIQRFEYD